MLTLHNSLKVARKVLNAVSRKTPKEANRVFTVKTLHNGREQGYALHYFLPLDGKMRAISFAENRNSDNIVVYHGEHGCDGIPTDETFRAANYFDPDRMDLAVRHILACVHNVLKQDKTQTTRQAS